MWEFGLCKTADQHDKHGWVHRSICFVTRMDQKVNTVSHLSSVSHLSELEDTCTGHLWLWKHLHRCVLSLIVQLMELHPHLYLTHHFIPPGKYTHKYRHPNRNTHTQACTQTQTSSNTRLQTHIWTKTHTHMLAHRYTHNVTPVRK